MTAPRPALQQAPGHRKVVNVARGFVTVIHPGRPLVFPRGRLLLDLPAFDSRQLASGRVYGVLHSLVMDACRILVNNQDLYLTTDIAGQQRCPTVPEHTLLYAGDYYLFRAGGSIGDDYPVVTDCNAWTFPLELPSSWAIHTPVSYELCSLSAMINAVKNYDGKFCIVTRFKSSKCSSLIKFVRIVMLIV